MNKQTLSDIVDVLKHPFKNIEQADAKTWLEYCEKDLLEAYKKYLEAKERLARALSKDKTK